MNRRSFLARILALPGVGLAAKAMKPDSVRYGPGVTLIATDGTRALEVLHFDATSGEEVRRTGEWMRSKYGPGARVDAAYIGCDMEPSGAIVARRFEPLGGIWERGEFTPC